MNSWAGGDRTGPAGGGGHVEFWLDEECGRRAERKHPPRRRPLAGLSLAVTGGAAAGIGAGFSAAWFLGAGALLLPPLFLWVRRRGSTGLLMLAAFCLMAAHARMSTGGRPGITLGSLLSGPVEYVPFVAVAVLSEPRTRARLPVPLAVATTIEKSLTTDRSHSL